LDNYAIASCGGHARLTWFLCSGVAKLAAAATAPTNLRFTFQTNPPELWLEWDPSTDNSDPQGRRAVDTSGNRSGPSNELNINC
jgi:hypothetical protein